MKNKLEATKTTKQIASRTRFKGIELLSAVHCLKDTQSIARNQGLIVAVNPASMDLCIKDKMADQYTYDHLHRALSTRFDHLAEVA